MELNKKVRNFQIVISKIVNGKANNGSRTIPVYNEHITMEEIEKMIRKCLKGD